MTVDDLAAKLNKNRATVYRYESDDIENLPISVIVPLARALKVHPAYIMGWEAGQDDVQALLAYLADESANGCFEAEDAMYNAFGTEREKLGIHVVKDRFAVLFYKAYESRDSAGLTMEIIQTLRDLSEDELLSVAGMLRGFVNRKDILDE